MAVWSSKARAAPPFQLGHHLVLGDISGSDIHTIPAEEKCGLSLYWLLLRALWPFQSWTQMKRINWRPCLLSPGLLNPAVTPWGSAKILLSSFFYLLYPPPPATPPQHTAPVPLKAGETGNLEKLGPRIPIGCGHFSQTELLFHQQISFLEFAALKTIFQV